MIRLFKLTAYAFLAYFLYEMLLGMTEERSAIAAPDRNPAGGDGERPKKVTIGDNTGAERTQVVGRGVR